MVSMSDWIIIYLLEQHSEKLNTQLKADQQHPLECCIVHLLNILWRASEVGSPTNHLGSAPCYTVKTSPDPPPHFIFFANAPLHIFMFCLQSAPPEDLKWNSPKAG